ncbi:uncharacterized protein LOC123562115 [Mercenaria mercenaria]|uniref:uncharacterized protein LOC123562115 n=1 Tax=Mercenaria mercenaria TaxID=6596 RepID=UPI00234F425D|nr:uncharacterized protein LOC123562115 [Mercenaria mercenaria]
MPVVTYDNLIYENCGKAGYIECTIAYWMWRIIPVVLLGVGFVGNIFNIAVLSRKELRKRSICVYLIFLAVSDTTMLCAEPLVQIVRIFSGINISTLSPVTCSLSIWLAYSSGSISCWLIVLVTVERTLLTLFLVNAMPKMTPRNALIASMTVVIVNALYTGHLLYGMTIIEINVNMTKVNMTEVNMIDVNMTEVNMIDVNMTEVNETKFESIEACIQRPGEYMEFFNTAWSIMFTLTNSVVPICFIVTGNAIVGISVIKRRRALRQHAGSNTSNIANQMRRNGFSTKIFFVLCGVFILTTVPFGTYFILLRYNVHVNEHTFAQYQLINILMRSLVWCNFSFNFLLYFMTGSLFRNEFQKMLRGACRKFVKERM